MTNHFTRSCRLTLCLVAGLAAAPALAQEKAPAPAPFAAPAIADDTLSQVAGREDTRQTALANLNAGVSNNSVGSNSTTGDAKISDQAFQNLSGLSILNVNTGNNVAINAAMNVTISIAPAQ